MEGTLSLFSTPLKSLLSSFSVVNGALEYLAKDLGIGENTILQGWVVSTLLAGVLSDHLPEGSFADPFGRTKTFILDAIPLTVGAFLWLDILEIVPIILLCLPNIYIYATVPDIIFNFSNASAQNVETIPSAYIRGGKECLALLLSPPFLALGVAFSVTTLFGDLS
ncbi:plastidic glucose transporter 4-like protein [Tanacetum coccineum]|uniref:Plastidic glucose transporter 4-like protein n=1 Tax=Tanacetum coccineum TaxID=301880 RepID=A0ABQ4WEI5_9ASTR